MWKTMHSLIAHFILLGYFHIQKLVRERLKIVTTVLWFQSSYSQPSYELIHTNTSLHLECSTIPVSAVGFYYLQVSEQDLSLVQKRLNALGNTKVGNLHHVHSSHITPPCMAFGSTGCMATSLSNSHLKQWTSSYILDILDTDEVPQQSPRLLLILVLLTSYRAAVCLASLHTPLLPSPAWRSPALGRLTGLERDELSFTLFLNLYRKSARQLT